MKSKKLIAAVLAATMFFANSAMAALTNVPGTTDADNKFTLTINIGEAKETQRIGMLTIFKTEISEADLKANDFERDDLLMSDIVVIPANATEINYTINMDGESNADYYINVKVVGSEIIKGKFEYTDYDTLMSFLGDLPTDGNAESWYDFFSTGEGKNLIDVVSEYSSYTEAEITNAFRNVLVVQEYNNIPELRENLEIGLKLVDMTKETDADGVRALVETLVSEYDTKITLDISENSVYGKLTDEFKNAVWVTIANEEIYTVEKLEETFAEAVTNENVNMLLEAIKNSVDVVETEGEVAVSDILTTENMQVLGLDAVAGIYNSYVLTNENVQDKFEELFAGTNCSTKTDIQAKFKECSILASYQALSDFTLYSGLITATKNDIPLSGAYFSWLPEYQYEVNKLMIAAAASGFADYTAISTAFTTAVGQIAPTVSGTPTPTPAPEISKGESSSIGGISYPVTTPKPTQPPVQTPAPTTSNYVDLAGFDWAETAIEEMTQMGIVEGVGEKKYEPARAMLKEEFVHLLVKSFDIDLENASCDLVDVGKDAWYYDSVSKLYGLEIVKGIGESKFGIGTEITREDMCTMIYRVLQYKDLKLPKVTEKIDFRDSEYISNYALEAVEALQTAGIVTGVGDDILEPKTPTNRAMATVVVYRLLKAIGTM